MLTIGQTHGAANANDSSLAALMVCWGQILPSACREACRVHRRGAVHRLPPSWQVRHWAFCTSTGVPQRLVNPMSAVLSSASSVRLEPGPWQASHTWR